MCLHREGKGIPRCQISLSLSGVQFKIKVAIHHHLFPPLCSQFSLHLPPTKQHSSFLMLRKFQSSSRCIAIVLFSVSKSLTLPLVHAKSLQSCLTLCNPPDCSPTRLLCPWGFSRQEYWSGWPCPPPGDLPDPGIEPFPLRSPTLAGRFFTTSTTWEAQLTPYPELFRFHLFLSSLLSCQSPIPGCFILNTNPPGTDPGG